ncbi:MAG: M48 family metallopeptidase [Burkholderiaceae bacterium]
MNELRALLFEGSTAAARSVSVVVDNQSVSLVEDGGARIFVPRSGLLVLTPPSAPRPVLQAAGGEQLVLPSDELIQRLELRPAAVVWTERASRSNFAALLAIAALACALFAALGWLLPRASQLAVEYLPQSAEARLRADILRIVDRGYLRPSALSTDEKSRIRARLKVLAEAGGLSGVRLEFRDGGAVGANALAVPGKVVVVTDQLVDLLGESRQLDAVLAHELGHVQHRHGLQALMRRTGFTVVIATLLHEQGLLERVARMAPQALLQAGYSREAEREADAFAFRLMRSIGGSPQDFADAIARWEKQRPDSTRTSSYLMSHPSSAERMEAAGAAK